MKTQNYLHYHPSSSNELQGTNNTTEEINTATIVSSKPKLVVQSLGSVDPNSLTWDGTKWVSDTSVPMVIPLAFGTELNVGGKYIFGASSGGWKPTATGMYRITFYIPTDSTISLTQAVIGNPPKTFITTPVVDQINNLTFVDVEVTGK